MHYKLNLCVAVHKQDKTISALNYIPPMIQATVTMKILITS